MNTGAEVKSLRDLAPRLRVGDDFAMIALPARPESMFVWFMRCPCCDKVQPDPNKVRGGLALMDFDIPGAGLTVQYALSKRCGLRLNGQSAGASERAQKVGWAVLGAHVAIEELAGRGSPSALVIDSPSTLAPGSKVVS